MTMNAKNHPLYTTWNSMRGRCVRTTSASYENYGERGISIYEPWRDDFWAFARDIERIIGKKPTSRHSFDRKNNDGDYEPNNVQWSTKEKQNNNKRNNNRVTAFGSTLTITRWAQLTGIHRRTLTSRIFEYNWSPERALTTPTRGK